MPVALYVTSGLVAWKIAEQELLMFEAYSNRCSDEVMQNVLL